MQPAPAVSSAPLEPTTRPAPSDLAGGWRLGFETLHTETPMPRELEVIAGELPRGLEGTLYRIGPGRLDVHGDRNLHWFDGDGMVQALTIDGARRVTYRARYVATHGKAKEDAARRRVYAGFGTRRPGGVVARFFARNERKNPANTNVVMHADKLLALCEGGRPYRLDPATVATIGEDSMDLTLPTSLDTFSAHPKVDRDTGEMWNFGIAYGREAEARLFCTTKEGRTRRVATVALPTMAMVHDFALTPSKAVLIVAPITLGRAPLALALGQRSFGETLRYRPELGVAVAVVDRATGETRWAKTEPFMMFHTAHAWDDGGDVVVDVCAYPDGRIMSALTDVMVGLDPSPARAELLRLRIRTSGEVVRSRPVAATLEFPRAAGRAWGREPRRVYGVTWSDEASFLNQPVAVDLERGRVERAPMAPGEFAGECVPVSKPGATSERDAWLLTLVLDARERRTELRILEAADLAAPPVARVALPHVVPFGFHGSFVRARASDL